MKQPVNFFKSLSDPTRLRILMLLLRKSLCVCQISFILGMEQSRISHQLRILRNADLVEGNRKGKWMFYKVPEVEKNKLEFIFTRIIGDTFMASEEITGDYEKLKAFQKTSLRNCSVSIER
ncbi:MAG: metalloregulator ArsR/SmtB family transcription factor [Candidatus Aminicenantes bacterium]